VATYAARGKRWPSITADFAVLLRINWRRETIPMAVAALLTVLVYTAWSQTALLKRTKFQFNQLQ